MKLGFLTAPFPDTPLSQLAAWASAAGFEAIEIACWPKPSRPARRYAGASHIDVANLSATQAKEIAIEMVERKIAISGLSYYPNPLHPDLVLRASVIGHLKKVIVAARQMGLPLVNTFCGGNASIHVDANWDEAQKVWPDIIAFARDNGIKLTFENCPMIFSYDEWPGGHNIAYSPYIWRRILEAWGGDVGLNYDPSHLVWLMIDQTRFIREFGPHILHVQAKDTMIDRDGLYERGSISAGMGWQIPRLPGLGEVDWNGLFSGLYRAGYDGAIIIEHEDRTFDGSDELLKRGLQLARDILRPYVK